MAVKPWVTLGAVAVLVGCGGFLAPGARAAVVARNAPAGGSQGNGFFANVQEAQTFTTTAGGPLSGVSLAFQAPPNPAGSITLQLRPITLTGLPSPTVLASKTLAPADVRRSNFSPLTYTDFDFTASNLSLTPGTAYALVLSSSSAGFEYSVLAAGNGYPDGEAFTSSDGGSTFLPYGAARPSSLDWGFEVRVVPEPAGAALLAAFGAAALAFHRRGRRR